MENTKVCKSCGRELPFSEFYHAEHNKDGLMGTCKSCHIKRSAEKVRQRRETMKSSGGGNLKKVYTHPDLAHFTERQLMAELAARGYHAEGTVTKRFSF